MKILKWILLVIASVIILGLIVAIFMPSKFRIEREVEINKPIDIVFDQVFDLEKSILWGPWYSYEPSAYKKVTGKGIGQTSIWEGDTLGTGSLKITSFQQNKSITQLLTFEKPMKSESNIYYKFETNNLGVKVSWAIEGNLSYPIGRFMKGSIEKNLEADFEKGLRNLKNLCDTLKNYPQIKEKIFHGLKLYAINEKCNMVDIASKIGSAYSELQKFLESNNIQMTGFPLAINNEYNLKTSYYDFDAAIPVNDNSMKPKGRIKQLTIFPSKVITAVHIGPYEELSKTYMLIEKYIKDNGLQINGKSFEEYINDPQNTTSDNLQTNIYYPFK